jgi:hypothetical protein
MLPTLSWIDFSEKDRRRMLDVVNLFREQETRDELGIGSVRDALAETLLPGTTTIMTRARYYLFVPWIYLHRERIIHNAGGHTGQSSVAERCRNDELYLIDALKAGGETLGVIGVEAGRRLQRLPSSVYWAGLGRWGIRRVPGGIADYHRRLQRYDPQHIALTLDDDNQPVGDPGGGNWHPAIPDAPTDWLSKITLALTEEEAVFLRERILGSCTGTLLAHLVDHCDPVAGDAGVTFPWMHPESGGFPAHIRRELDHAARFSLLMHGAALLYNLMLAKAIGSEEWEQSYRAQLKEWAAELSATEADWRAWQLAEFWSLAQQANPRIPRGTQRFIEAWIERVRSLPKLQPMADDDTARRMVRHRELQLKRSRSRLADPRRREQWSGASGTARMDYRWSTVRPIVNDILEGLG